MAMRRFALRDWLAEVLEETQDTLGTYELALGGAILIGYLVLWWLRAWPGWGLAVLWFLCLAGVWLGAHMEDAQFHRLGRRRFRGTLYRRITWLTVACALLLGGVLLGLAHARAWNELPGWRDGPVLMLLTLGLYHLALGLRTRTRRWVYLGGALLALAVLIPGVGVLRSRTYLVTALLAGATLIAAGLSGRMRYERELGAGQAPRAASGGSD
ncbi:MAG: hypothetical protein GX557_11965 [Chloroflexi bacterium]|nr:hypothetical protein [Chloroflexota bacterium]